MPSIDTPNKKRRLNVSSDPVASSKPRSKSIIPPLPSSLPKPIKGNVQLNAGSLDGDAVRRHMLELMSGGGNGDDDEDRNGSDDEGISGDESGSSGSDSNDDEVSLAVSDHEGSVTDHDNGNGSSRIAPDAKVVTQQSEDPQSEDVKPRARSPPTQTKIASRTGLSRLTPKLLEQKPSHPTKSGPIEAMSPLKSAPPTPFSTLPLHPVLIRALHSLSLTHPTPIQAACLKPLLSGRDVIGLAQTGSGKTIAFGLPILQRLSLDPFGIFALVLTPTRELAYQLSEQFLALGKPLGLETVTIVGGMDMMKQAGELKGRPHVVIATPGRLCDLLRSCSAGEWDLRRVKVLVLDEADRLLTPTFAPDLAYLFSQLPPDRQTCLFTATISPAIQALADRPPRPGKQPIFVHRIESDTLTVKGLRQNYLFIPGHVRDPYLIYLLKEPPKEIAHLRRKVAVEDEPPKHQGNGRKRKARDQPKDDEDETPAIPSTIIFTQRCATAHLLHLMLKELDIPSVPLHSHLTQPERLASLARFRAGSVPVLVTTDVGSRGLDIPEVAMVINWDCPRTGEDYVHRVGRTARAGRGGMAITIVTERDVELVKGIEELTNVKLTELELPEETVLEQLNVVATARRVANMAMHDSDFGERQATNKAKDVKRAKRDARARA